MSFDKVYKALVGHLGIEEEQATAPSPVRTPAPTKPAPSNPNPFKRPNKKPSVKPAPKAQQDEEAIDKLREINQRYSR